MLAIVFLLRFSNNTSPQHWTALGLYYGAAQVDVMLTINVHELGHECILLGFIMVYEIILTYIGVNRGILMYIKVY